MGTRKAPVDADPKVVWGLWSQGYDTREIGWLLQRPEYAVYGALQRAREARRRPYVEDHPTPTPERQSPLADH